MGWTSLFGEGNGKKTKLIVFPLFRTRTGITKKLSSYLERERNYQKAFPLLSTGMGNTKNLPAVREREFKTFPLGNIRDWELPFMAGTYSLDFFSYMVTVNISLTLSESYKRSHKPKWFKLVKMSGMVKSCPEKSKVAAFFLEW